MRFVSEPEKSTSRPHACPTSTQQQATSGPRAKPLAAIQPLAAGTQEAAKIASFRWHRVCEDLPREQ